MSTLAKFSSNASSCSLTSRLAVEPAGSVYVAGNRKPSAVLVPFGAPSSRIRRSVVFDAGARA